VNLVGARPATDGAIRWSFEVASPDARFIAYVDTTPGGVVVDMQTSDGRYGSSGGPALNETLRRRVANVVGLRAALRALDDAAQLAKPHGVERLRYRRWAA
jgi:hypothetical protein